MIIRNGNKTVNVVSILGDSLRRGSKVYPALKFEFEDQITSEDLAVLLSGSFEILDDNGNVLGTHEGYNTMKSLSVSIGKITTDEQKIEELEATVAATEADKAALEASLADSEAANAELTSNLETAQAENAELQNAIDIMVGGNAE